MTSTPNRARSAVSRWAAATALVIVGTTFFGAPAQALAELSTIDLDGGTNPHGIAFTPDGTLAFVANAGSDTVGVINTASHQLIVSIPVGDEPVDVAVSPNGTLAYVAAASGDTITVIDVATLSVMGDPIPVGNFPARVAFSVDGSKAYVAGYGSHTMVVIDVATATVTDTLTGTVAPQGLGMSTDGATLWIMQSGNAKVQALTTATNALSTGFVVNDPNDPDEQLRFLDVSPDGTTLAVGGDRSNYVYLVDVATEAIVDSVDVGDLPYAIVYSPDGARLWIGLANGGVALIDTATATVIDTVGADSSNGSWGVAPSPTGDFGYATNYYNNTVSIIGDPPLVNRVSGPSRYETGIAISKRAYPTTASTVWVATGANYPDALAAGPAAAAQDAPLLLTETAVLTPAVAAEIERLDPDKIVVVGGLPSVSAATYSALAAIQPNIERISGPDRFATSRAIAEYGFGGGASAVYIATGLNFPDALSAGSAGAASGTPVILVNGIASAVDAATVQLISDLGATSVTIAGGTNQVSAGIQSQLSATRIAGTSRYETSRLVNEAAYPGTANRVLLATGLNFPDALAGSAWAGALGAPLFVVPGDCIPQSTLDNITALDPLQITLLGGVPSLNQDVFALQPCP